MSASAFWESAHWIAAPVFFAAVAALVYCIRRVIAVQRAARILSVPLAAEQEVTFREAGEVVLCGEGPPLTTRFGPLHFTLTDAAGREVPGRPILLRGKSSGFTRVRIDLRRFTLPHAGTFTLRVPDLGAPQKRDADHEILFMRPVHLVVAAWIVGIAISGWLLIGSLVVFILRVGGVDEGE